MSTRIRRIVETSQAVIEQIDKVIWPNFDPVPANLKYVARQAFGLSVIEKDRVHEFGEKWVGSCDLSRDDDFTVYGTISIRPNLTDQATARAILHELAEYLAVKAAPALYDEVWVEYNLLFTGGDTPKDVRHQIATKVVDYYAAKWKLGKLDPASEFRIKVDVALITAEQWHREHSPLPDIETIDPDIVI